MIDNRCVSTWEISGRLIQCEREHAHGGVHQAVYADEDWSYVFSWWPTPHTTPASDDESDAASGGSPRASGEQK